jgi:hypothetical protein
MHPLPTKTNVHYQQESLLLYVAQTKTMLKNQILTAENARPHQWVYE